MKEINLITKFILMFLGGVFVINIFTSTYFTSVNQNGTFILNGTDEWFAIQYMDYNKKQLIKSYDLEQVIIGNFCKEQRGYISEITSNSFELQCCQNFTSCENYILINKNIEEVRLR